MKWNVPMLILMVMLGALVAFTLIGCTEQQEEVTGEMIDYIPEAAEEVYTDEPETPGVEETPGLEVEEMIDDTPPHVEEPVEDVDPADDM